MTLNPDVHANDGGHLSDHDTLHAFYNTNAALSGFSGTGAAATVARSDHDHNSTYETQAHASATYETQANAASTYETQANATATYATITVTITSQTGASYTFALADSGSEVEGNSASAQTFTIPPNSTVAFPVGTTINVRQMGAGQVTVAAGVGVTLRAPNGAKTAKQYSTAGLIKRATDEWIVSGDTVT